MAHGGARREAVLDRDAQRYERHCPEQTLLYRLVEQHYPAFVAELAADGREVPGYVAREFEESLRCGRLEHGFLRVKAPERAEPEVLVHRVSERVGWHLERQGLLVRDAETSYLALESEGADALPPVLGSAITFLARDPQRVGAVLGIFLRVIEEALRQATPGRAAGRV